MIVALYARVSTDKQDETLQLPRLRELAAARGYQIFKEYKDEASGKDANRPGWKELMGDASHHRFDAIMAVKLDRVMRSLVALASEMDRLDRYGVSLICGDVDVNTSTPSGKMQLQLMAAIAEWERSTISVRTKEGLAARRAAGTVLGRRKRQDVPVHRIALMRQQGQSWSQISRTLEIPRTTILERREKIEAEIE